MVWTIKRVSMSNFKVFPSDPITSAEFDDKLSILSGPNGFGKTTVFDALELIFSHSMTRFNDIENGNQRFKNHLFLNDPSRRGFLCVDLFDGNQTQQYCAIISNDKNWQLKNMIKESFSYFKLEQDNIITNWKDASSESVIQLIEKKGNTIKEPVIKEFNICYYVSQEESAHLLKEQVNYREKTLAPLIGQEQFDNRFNTFKNKSELFKYDDNQLRILINELKLLSHNESIQTVKHIKIYPEKNLDWDAQKVEDLANISEYITSLEELKKASKFVKEIEQYFTNRKIDRLINDAETNELVGIMHREKISDTVELKSISHSEKEKKDTVNMLTRLFGQLRNAVAAPLLRSDEIREAILKTDNLIKVIETDELGIIDDLENTIDNLKGIIEYLESRIKLLNIQDKITTEKENLKQITTNIKKNIGPYTQLVNKKNVHCPVCYSDFTSLHELQENIDKVGGILELVVSKELKDLNKNWKLIEIARENITSTLSSLANKGKLIDWQSVNIEVFIEEQVKIEKLDNLLNYIEEKQIKLDYDLSWLKQIAAEKEEISGEFLQLLDGNSITTFVKGLISFLDVHSESTLIHAISNVKEEQLNSKIDYLLYLKKSADNVEYQSVLTKLKVKVKEKLQWEKMLSAYCEADNIIKDNEKKLKKTIVEAIRIPLLIYTAKMLQNYQGGLGVYIDDNTLRFVSSDKQPDILNKFSSGQLSAFVLTFLLLMNKLYVNDSKQYQFLLIDDPVQTMDEINLSSFVDVLRREFADKQIILSTHEEDKKNYIGYKFIKNGSSVKVINVKDQWYSA